MTTSGLLIDLERSPDDLMKDSDNIITSISATMTHFPLCCSTGVLNNMQAQELTKHNIFSLTQKKAIKVDPKSIKNAIAIHELLNLMKATPMFFPREVAEWNAMSKILQKCTTGQDDVGTGGYRNYKAAQILMCDRICEDKRNPKFNFSSYNIVYSIDQFMDALIAYDGKYGEVYVSPAIPGGHGARVRSCVFTPNTKALQTYHDERLEKLRAHILAYMEWTIPVPGEPVDKVAALW